MATNKDFIIKNDVTLGGTISKINGITLTNGQLLIGSSSTGDMSVATLTGSASISVTNGPGSITLDLPNTGIAPGMYSSVTVDSKGRAISGVPVSNTSGQVFAGSVAQTTGTTLIPYDSTPPLVSEGTQVWSQTITPVSTGSKVKIEFSGILDSGTANRTITVAVFRGTTFIGAIATLFSAATAVQSFALLLVDTPGTIAATTYTCRIGISSNATWNLGRGSSATFGGTNPSGWSIVEVLA